MDEKQQSVSQVPINTLVNRRTGQIFIESTGIIDIIGMYQRRCGNNETNQILSLMATNILRLEKDARENAGKS